MKFNPAEGLLKTLSAIKESQLMGRLLSEFPVFKSTP